MFRREIRRGRRYGSKRGTRLYVRSGLVCNLDTIMGLGMLFGLKQFRNSEYTYM